MEHKNILEESRKKVVPYCKACLICKVRACGIAIPGPGLKPPGNGAARNYDAWQDICVNMDTICNNN